MKNFREDIAMQSYWKYTFRLMLLQKKGCESEGIVNTVCNFAEYNDDSAKDICETIPSLRDTISRSGQFDLLLAVEL